MKRTEIDYMSVGEEVKVYAIRNAKTEREIEAEFGQVVCDIYKRSDPHFFRDEDGDICICGDLCIAAGETYTSDEFAKLSTAAKQSGENLQKAQEEARTAIKTIKI